MTNVTFTFETSRNTKPKEKKLEGHGILCPHRLKKWGDTTPVFPTKLHLCLRPIVLAGVSYYTKDYWETFLSNKTPRFRNPSGSPSFDPPKPCQCNKHSNRCEHIPTYDFLMCVDCRHHTQGQNCHRCDRRYFKDPTKSLDDPEVCQGMKRGVACTMLSFFSSHVTDGRPVIM